MEVVIKRFNELSIQELYEIYHLRVAVFVVEQNCPYQEIDEHDLNSIHVYFREEGKIIAYLRVLPQGETFDDVSIGRVISIKRRQGVGTKLLEKGIEIAKKEYNAKKIVIEAQTYARKLYEKQGFKQSSEEFLEDGIPHIQMTLEME